MEKFASREKRSGGPRGRRPPLRNNSRAAQGGGERATEVPVGTAGRWPNPPFGGRGLAASGFGRGNILPRRLSQMR